MECSKCKVEITEENKCCDGGTRCKTCCDCKEETKESCSGCDCHCN